MNSQAFLAAELRIKVLFVEPTWETVWSQVIVRDVRAVHDELKPACCTAHTQVRYQKTIPVKTRTARRSWAYNNGTVQQQHLATFRYVHAFLFRHATHYSLCIPCHAHVCIISASVASRLYPCMSRSFPVHIRGLSLSSPSRVRFTPASCQPHVRFIFTSCLCHFKCHCRFISMSFPLQFCFVSISCPWHARKDSLALFASLFCPASLRQI